MQRNICVMLMILLISTTSCQTQQHISSDVGLLVEKERRDERILFEKFKKYGKDAIPHLISVIDKDEKGVLGFQDQNSATLYLVNYNYVGMRAAYMIELIFSDAKDFKIYQYGVIVIKENNKPIMEVLSMKEMKELKAIYEKWWKVNAAKSLEELREQWNNSQRVLTNTNYVWQ